MGNRPLRGCRHICAAERRAARLEERRLALASFTGHVSVDTIKGAPTTVPLFDRKPLIFQLKKDWRGDGRLVPRITEGHFIVIAPKGWDRTGHAPIEPEGCSDPAFMAHYFFRDGTESATNLGGFREHDVPSSAPEFTLGGRTVFDDSGEGDLFVGDPPRLKPADRVLWARVGEEGEDGWKGCNFKPAERTLAEAMGARQGRFFLRVYDERATMLDGAQFRYLRDLREIRVNGEPYSEDMLLAPPATGHPPTKVRFIGVDGAQVRVLPRPGTAAVADEMGGLVAERRPEADTISCTLEAGEGSVEVALRLPRVWWRLDREDGNGGDGEWRSTPIKVTRDQFRERADANAVLRLGAPKRFGSVSVGFGAETEIRYRRKDEGFELPLGDFVDHVEVARRMAAETRLNVRFGRFAGRHDQPVLTLVRIAADPPLPGPARQLVAKVRRGGGGWRAGRGFSHREVRAAAQLDQRRPRASTRRATGEERPSIRIDGRRRSRHPANVETLRKEGDV